MGRRKSPEKPLFNPKEASQLVVDTLKHCSSPEEGLTKSHLLKEISKHYTCSKDDFDSFIAEVEGSGSIRRIRNQRYASSAQATGNTGNPNTNQGKPKTLEEHVDQYGQQHSIELR